MTEWEYIIVLLSILLSGFLLWKEGKRKNRQWLLWRCLATILAAGSLMFIALPLYYNKTLHDVSTSEAILLTEGYNKDSLNHFREEKGKQLPVFYINRNVEVVRKFGSGYVPDIRLLPNKAIKTYHVFGYGLSEEEWGAFSPTHIVFHSSLPPSGIRDIHWNQVCKNGEPVTVQGSCNNRSPGTYKMILTSFTETLDSVFILPDTNGDFSLTAIPKTEGRQTLRLTVIAGKDTVETETVPVQVEQGKLLNILMLSSSPDFDTKFLKNFLSEEGCKVAARTTISKNKYAYDYLNMDAVSLENIASSLLDKFDLIIADASELAHLPATQSGAVKAAVSQKGTGLVIKADSLLSSSFYAGLLPVSGVGDSAQSLKLMLTNTSQKLPALVVNYPASIRPVSRNQLIVQDAKNKMYAASALYGSGKIAITTLSGTYTWTLSGNEEGYRRFWSALLSKAIATPVTEESWSVSPSLPVVNAPVQLQLQTEETNSIPQGIVNGTPVYLESNPGLPFLWSGTYWPRREGWQIGTATDGKPFYWFVYSPADWQNVRASQKIIATQRYIASHLYEGEGDRANLTERTEFPKLYFFVLFVISAGFLWAEGKGLFGSRK